MIAHENIDAIIKPIITIFTIISASEKRPIRLKSVTICVSSMLFST